MGVCEEWACVGVRVCVGEHVCGCVCEECVGEHVCGCGCVCEEWACV